jgi:hypothetical protein
VDTKIITLPAHRIENWETFHAVCKESFGFPDFYGRNMDAWIDCMSYIDETDAGMTNPSVEKGGLVVIKVDEAPEFAKRCPEQYSALLECTAFVNYRRVKRGEPALLALMLVGYY